MTRFLFIGTAEGKHNFITQDKHCNILVHYEYADRNDTSGASGKYKRWQFYEFDNPRTLFVGTDSPEYKKWNTKLAYAQQLNAKHRSVEHRTRVEYNAEPRKPITGLTDEQRAKLKEMDARDEALVKLQPILADHQRVSFTKQEKAVLAKYKQYIPQNEKAWVEYILDEPWKKVKKTPVCPF